MVGLAPTVVFLRAPIRDTVAQPKMPLRPSHVRLAALGVAALVVLIALLLVVTREASAPDAGKGTRQDDQAPGWPSRDDSDEYARGLELYRHGKRTEAYDVYLRLAHKNIHHPGVLGMLVANLASSSLNVPRVAGLEAEADAHPDDKLAQLIAGVAAHYHAHNEGKTLEEKKQYYAIALRYLARARPELDFEPRLHIYLAVSDFRLGHQDEAEKHIEEAVGLGGRDPDVYYCRAEIFQRKNLPRSLEDLRTYMAMIEENVRTGAPSSAGKDARVRAMYDHLQAVSRGEASGEEIFDPIEATDRSRQIRGLALAGLGIAGTAALGASIYLRRRQRRSREVGSGAAG